MSEIPNLPFETITIFYDSLQFVSNTCVKWTLSTIAIFQVGIFNFARDAGMGSKLNSEHPNEKWEYWVKETTTSILDAKSIPVLNKSKGKVQRVLRRSRLKMYKEKVRDSAFEKKLMTNFQVTLYQRNNESYRNTFRREAAF